MDLSIIIPVHNLENYIDPLLSSLMTQNIGDYDVELLFVLDNCTDGTAKKLFQVCADQYTINLINTDVRSCGLARNIGLDHASGEYIWFVDGDDWIVNNQAIWTILTTMKTQDEKIIRFDYEAPSFKFYGFPSMVWQYCMRKDFIGDLRFTSIQPHEDVKFMGQLLCDLTNPIFFLNTKLYHYNYMREGSNMWQWAHNHKIET